VGEFGAKSNGDSETIRNGPRNLLTLSASLRWYLQGDREPDQIADEILEYAAAQIVLDEIESRYPNVRALVDAVETAGRVAAGLRLASNIGGVDAVIGPLEERLAREQAHLVNLMGRIQHPEPEKLLVSYQRITDLACGTIGA
jgi:hypothetical protein